MTLTTPKLIDRAKVIAVIEAEQILIAAEMVGGACESPGHCALGALLFAAGIPNHRLREKDAQEPTGWPDDLEEAMRETYGLRRRHSQQIMESNDNEDTPEGEDVFDMTELRRARVLARVHNICDEQSREPALDEHLCDEFETRGGLPF